jgi:hypothetical protein
MVRVDGLDRSEWMEWTVRYKRADGMVWTIWYKWADGMEWVDRVDRS